MIKLQYIPQAGPFGDMPDAQEITMTLGDNVTWDGATNEFHNFLRAAGYVIPYDFEDEKRSHEEFLQDLDDWAKDEKPAWIPLKITERNRIIDEWNSLVECTVRATKEGRITMLCKMIEAKLKELNT